MFNQAAAVKEDPASSWSDSLWRMYQSSSSTVRFIAGGTKYDPSAFETLLKELTDMTQYVSGAGMTYASKSTVKYLSNALIKYAFKSLI